MHTIQSLQLYLFLVPEKKQQQNLLSCYIQHTLFVDERSQPSPAATSHPVTSSGWGHGVEVGPVYYIV